MVTVKKITKTEIPCDLCGSTRSNVLYPDELGDTPAKVDYNFSPDTRKTYQIVRCQSCGLIFTNPMPNLNSIYEDTVDEIYLASSKQRYRTAEKSLKQILKYKSSGKLLDVGCSTGIFLDVASHYFDVEGIELSHWAFDETAKRHKVYDQPLESLGFSERYDVITLWGVIEHFQNPAREIRSIASALKPTGLLVLYTGDVDALLPRLLGKKWWWYQGMHLYYFSKRTCSLVLNQCGLKVLSSDLHPISFQLYSLGISLNRYKIGKFLNPIFNLPFIRNIIISVKLSGEMVLFAQKY
jgi:SAM-dependent methyltransferase